MFERHVRDPVVEKKADKEKKMDRLNVSNALSKRQSILKNSDYHNKTKEVVMGISPLEKLHMSSIMDNSNFLDDAKR